ncbi:acyltransferase [Intrasporangium sp.]|uniref:acyltransferase n=1 Tax=Intrasporangium sp. TaxID=1925024 RepID=UPI003221AC22
MAYDGFARRLHTMLPGGHRLRARLANSICASVERSARIAPDVKLSRHLVVLDGAGIGAGTLFTGAERITLGRRLKMGPRCMFITNDHPVPADHQTFSEIRGTNRPIVVGDDVFIGAGSIILGGVTIGRGAAVGAGSVVVRDVPPGAVVVGAPARVVYTRNA